MTSLSREIQELYDSYCQGEMRSLARLISLVDRGDREGHAVAGLVYPSTGGAYRLGITGPPGVGKSTLIERLIGRLRLGGKTVGVVAVDPSSPAHGGALLGDRIRMQAHHGDAGVFVRSLSSHGDTGGLSDSADIVADLLDAFGMDWVILETVGVGQAALEVSSSTYTTVVVLVPESGDTIQGMKSGLMEIGDLYVLNKCDRPGASSAAEGVREALMYGSARDGWDPSVVMVSALEDEGVDEVMEEITKHREFTGSKIGMSALRLRASARRIRHAALTRLNTALTQVDAGGKRGEELAAEVLAGKRTLDEASDALLRQCLREGGI